MANNRPIVLALPADDILPIAKTRANDGMTAAILSLSLFERINFHIVKYYQEILLNKWVNIEVFTMC